LFCAKQGTAEKTSKTIAKMLKTLVMSTVPFRAVSIIHASGINDSASGRPVASRIARLRGSERL
jgi:hypothetical protein